MSEIKSIIKIKSAIRSSFANNKIATIIHRGDEDNGAILLKIRRNDSKSFILGKSLSVEGQYVWKTLIGNQNDWLEEALVTTRIENELKIDPDLWVLEIESDTIWNPLEVS
jgi:hypothetical protein